MPDDRFVIGYDIADPKRLIRIHHAMKDFACPLQYSVFLFSGSEECLAAMLEPVKALMDMPLDDLRCYKLPSGGMSQRFGKSVLPEGILWTGMPTAATE